MIIYNKTREIEEEIKKFWENQYDLAFTNMAHRPNLIDSETVQYLYDNRKIEGYFETNKDNIVYYEGFITLAHKNKESTVVRYDISGSYCFNMNSNNIINNNNLSRNNEGKLL